MRKLERSTSIIAIATVINVAVVWHQSCAIDESNRQAARAADAAAAAVRIAENQLLVGLGQIDTGFAGITVQQDIARAQQTANENASRSQEELAREQLATQRQAMRLERRAWVAAGGLTNVVVRAGETMRFSVPLSNTGETPARNVIARMQIRTLPVSEPFMARYDEARTQSRMVLQPGMNVGFNRISPIPLTQDEIAILKKGDIQRIYVFGEILYDDIFAVAHKTTFCQFLDVDLAFKWCDTYNEAD